MTTLNSLVRSCWAKLVEKGPAVSELAAQLIIRERRRLPNALRPIHKLPFYRQATSTQDLLTLYASVDYEKTHWAIVVGCAWILVAWDLERLAAFKRNIVLLADP